MKPYIYSTSTDSFSPVQPDSYSVFDTDIYYLRLTEDLADIEYISCIQDWFENQFSKYLGMSTDEIRPYLDSEIVRMLFSSVIGFDDFYDHSTHKHNIYYAFTHTIFPEYCSLIKEVLDLDCTIVPTSDRLQSPSYYNYRTDWINFDFVFQHSQSDVVNKVRDYIENHKDNCIEYLKKWEDKYHTFANYEQITLVDSDEYLDKALQFILENENTNLFWDLYEEIEPFHYTDHERKEGITKYKAEADKIINNQSK